METQTITENQNKKSQAKKIETLFLKYKKWGKEYYETQPLKEPIMYLERIRGQVEFYENVTSGMYEFKHSNGEQRFIIITPKKQKTFGIGKNKYKGYYCHEDHPLPLPNEPDITSEQMNVIVEKSLHDRKEWETKKAKATGEMWWKIAIGIAAIILAIAFLKMMIPTQPPTQPVIQATKVAIQNTTATILS